MSLFSSHQDFDEYHQANNEVCDYVEMKTEMLSGLVITSYEDGGTITNLAMDGSWLDFGDIPGAVFEGIGDFIAGILD
jgi:hypothetical protein